MKDNKTLVGSGARIGRSYVTANNLDAVFHSGPFSVKKSVKASAKLARTTEQLVKNDIGKWRSSWQAAIDIENPSRVDLYSIYRDAMIDNHLSSAIRNRKLETMKRNFKIVGPDGKTNDEKTKLLKTGWFRRFVSLAMDAEFYGHSLIQFGDIINGQFSYVEEVPRQHVIPEKGIIVSEIGDESGFDFRKGPLSTWCIEVGEKDNLGLLLKACPQAISKRHQLAFWDEFSEIFGIPMRVAKNSSKDLKVLNEIQESLKLMGHAAYGIFPDGTEIDIKESASRDAYEVFDKKIDRGNSEMSKLILGQTMTMDNGSSRSQSEVHERVSETISDSDGVMISELVNDKLIPFLIMHGYSFTPQDIFDWDDTRELPLKEQMEIDAFLIQWFEIELEYYQEKYNSHITGFKKKTEPIAADGGAAGGK